VRLAPIGGNPNPRIEELDRSTGKVNYLQSKDPGAWKRNVPTYGRVAQRNVWDGIDLVYYGNQRSLEYHIIEDPRSRSRRDPPRGGGRRPRARPRH